MGVGKGPNPTTVAERRAKSEAFRARREAHRKQLWEKIDGLLALVKVGCPATCDVEHEHQKASSGRELKDLAITYGILLDKFRLETGTDVDASDLEEFFKSLGAAGPLPSHAKAKRVARGKPPRRPKKESKDG